MRRAVARTFCIAALIAALGYDSPLSAQANAQPACTAQQHRQFDFWVGDWEVVDTAGQVAGHNRITREMGGCALREEWTSAAGGTGSSFNIYDAATGQWHQTWVDTHGTLLMLDGGLQSDGVMVMEGERPAAAGATARHRITWTRQTPDRVRQLWQVSDDGGVSWRGLFDGTYRRIASAGNPEDVATPEALVAALYAIMSRRAGEPFDWSGIRTLFLPTARLIPNTEQTAGEFRVLSVDEFIAWIDRVSVIGGPEDHGFQEEEIATRIEQFGDIAHAFSTYQKHFHGSDDILGHGINSIQMVRMNDRWWVSQIVWDEETGAGPIPDMYRGSGR